MATRVDEHGEVWLDTATAALVLGFSAQYLGRLAIAERIPGRRDVTRVGRPWLFRRRDIEQLAASTASRAGCCGRRSTGTPASPSCTR